MAKGINLGELQVAYETSNKAATAAGKALERAQEVYDAARKKRDADANALKEASRTVLG